MRRIAPIVALALLPASAALPAAAHPGHPGPRITRFEFVRMPLKAGAFERLVVVAHDPDSWISEIQVAWEDEEGAGGVIFAHTHCVQDPAFERPGARARLRMDLTFEHPGTYHVAALAISEKRCEGGNDTRISKMVELDVTVRDPHRAFVDPDDTDGPLDVLTLEQTVVAVEPTFANQVTHTLTMSDDLGSTPLAGAGDEVELRFDTDGDPSTFERFVLVDAGSDGALRALVIDDAGALLGEATVTADGATLSVDVDERLLARRVGRYRWVAITRDASGGPCSMEDPCIDRAPNAGTYRHAL